MTDKVQKSATEWNQSLNPEAFHVLRKRGTEHAFTGLYWNLKDDGVYRCAGCGQRLFESATKYDSGSGWPSFWAPTSEDAVETEPDDSLFTRRVEVHCSRCGGHLGHVFSDGPEPTGLRYCVNSASLAFEPNDDDD